MTSRVRTAFYLILVASLGVLPAAAQQPVTTTDGAAAAATGGTHTVKKGPLRIEVPLVGVFEAAEMHPLLLKTEVWSNFTVLEAVEHGTRVKAGDTLVTFDPQPFDTALVEAEAAYKLADLAMQQAQLDMQILEANMPFDLEALEREKKVIEEDLKYYLEITKPMSERTVAYDLKGAEYALESSQEELKQLEQMYKADDLTEETEEIILKRARFDAERAQFYLDYARATADQQTKYLLPRSDIQTRDFYRRQELDWQKSKLALPANMTRAKLALERQQTDFKLQTDRLEKLKKERELLTIKSPADGIVYYGQCIRGRWMSLQGDGKYPVGTPIMPNGVFMTIVNPRPMIVRSSLAEKDLQHVVVGIGGKVQAVALPNARITAKVDAVATIPTADGTFDIRISTEIGEDAATLLPGMNCSITLVAYNKPDAVTVPPAAIFPDDVSAKEFVFRVGADGAYQKTEVTTGKRTDDKVEILQGLLEGDQILLENPEKKS